MQQIRENNIKNFAEKYGVRIPDLREYAYNFNPSTDNKDQIGYSSVTRNADYNKFNESAKESISKLKHSSKLRKDAQEFVIDEVLTYIVG